MRKTVTTLYRDFDSYTKLIEIYREMKLDFVIKNSRYSTNVEFDNSKIRLITNHYSTKVFIANSMIKNDIKNSKFAQSLLKVDHPKINYDSKNNQGDGKWHKIINIDINSAYANCLFNNNIITKKTFDYISKLTKSERLPSMGMLAKNQIVINFENGIPVKNFLFVGLNAQIFYFLIAEINRLMKIAVEIAGEEYFLFYWTDGLFLKYDIPVDTLKKIENLFLSNNYIVKYEKVENLSWFRKGNDTVEINMIKNGIKKCYRFADRNFAKNFKEFMVSLIERNPFELCTTDLHELERTASFDEFDNIEWMA